MKNIKLKDLLEQNQDMTCTCPECGHKWKKEKHEPCKEKKCPKCDHIIGNPNLSEQQLRDIIEKYIRVVRGGKRMKKKKPKKGFKVVNGKYVKMKSSEKLHRKKAQRKGARKRKAKKSIINRKRKRSMKKRP